jgi:hypothetical protein
VPTNLYVDGFNFYNGMFKRGRVPNEFKWVDFAAAAVAVWPALAPINRVRYFTARVKPNPGDPNNVVRKQIYLRALAATGADIHYGQFKHRAKLVLRCAT